MTTTSPSTTSFALLRPAWLSARNRILRRERGDIVRAAAFGSVAAAVAFGVLAIMRWVVIQLLDYQELGDYIIRLGLSWLFLTFLSFLVFSALVVALSTFFLSEDLWLLIPAPIPLRQLVYSRLWRTLLQAGWMVVVFAVPVLAGIGLARCAGPDYYVAIPLVLAPFTAIPVSFGALVTLLIVNTFPARRARDVLLMSSVVFAAALVALFRFLRPERLLTVQSLPDITGFFATMDTRVTPLLPSFWAGEILHGTLRGQWDLLHLGALWTTGLVSLLLTSRLYQRYYLAGWSRSQEARKARFTRLVLLGAIARRLPMALPSRALFVKDVKIFLRDATQWSQLLLLLSLVFVYLYSFSVLDPSRVPYMSDMIRVAYVFLNLAMSAFVLAAISVRFVFPSVSAEAAAFWMVRTSPVSMRAFLWSKFWIGFMPILLMVEVLAIVSNHFLDAAPFLRGLSAIAMLFMTFALVGLAAGMGAIYPRFRAENLAQVAGSFGGVAFMLLAVFFILVEIVLLAWPSSIYLWHEYRGIAIAPHRKAAMVSVFSVAALLAVGVGIVPLRQGIRALERLQG